MSRDQRPEWPEWWFVLIVNLKLKRENIFMIWGKTLESLHIIGLRWQQMIADNNVSLWVLTLSFEVLNCRKEGKELSEVNSWWIWHDNLDQRVTTNFFLGHVTDDGLRLHGPWDLEGKRNASKFNSTRKSLTEMFTTFSSIKIPTVVLNCLLYVLQASIVINYARSRRQIIDTDHWNDYFDYFVNH